jgi:RimJ/RimL family protein N-acetyltransferase
MIGKVKNVTLSGKMVSGERLNPFYFNFMLEMLNNPEINRMEGKVFKQQSILDQETWFKLNSNKLNCDFWVFIEKFSKTPVGYFSVKLKSTEPLIGHIGIKISPNFQGKGYGKDILNTIESYYFEKCNLDKLVSHIVEYNLASLHLFINSNGWKKIGLEKGTVKLGTDVFDQITIELSQKDFYKKVKGISNKLQLNDI